MEVKPIEIVRGQGCLVDPVPQFGHFSSQVLKLNQDPRINFPVLVQQLCHLELMLLKALDDACPDSQHDGCDGNHEDQDLRLKDAAERQECTDLFHDLHHSNSSDLRSAPLTDARAAVGAEGWLGRQPVPG